MLYGVSFIVLPAALNGLLKELMPEEMLVDANSSLQTTKESFRLFGPLVGALLFTWLGGWAVAVLDAASFFVAAARDRDARGRGRTAPEVEEAHFWDQMTAGLRHLGARAGAQARADRLRHCASWCLGFTESSIYALLDAFDRPATFVSVIVSVQGVGAVAGGLVLERGGQADRRGRDVRGRAWSCWWSASWSWPAPTASWSSCCSAPRSFGDVAADA